MPISPDGKAVFVPAPRPVSLLGCIQGVVLFSLFVYVLVAGTTLLAGETEEVVVLARLVLPQAGVLASYALLAAGFVVGGTVVGFWMWDDSDGRHIVLRNGTLTRSDGEEVSAAIDLRRLRRIAVRAHTDGAPMLDLRDDLGVVITIPLATVTSDDEFLRRLRDELRTSIRTGGTACDDGARAALHLPYDRA